MGPVKKILCAIDFSEHSRGAMAEAADWAKAFGARLSLLHVVAEPASIAGDVVAAPPELFEQARRDAEGQLGAWRAQAEERLGTAVEGTVLAHRRPAQGIVRFAREGGFDLIVIATHGRTGLKHLMLGSVAEKVVREAPCRVLVARRSQAASRCEPSG